MNNKYYRNGILHTMTDEEQQEWESNQPTIEQKLQEAKDKKCDEIDSNTSKSIIALVGNDVQQRNKTAKSVQLSRKEIAGTITDEELVMLEALDEGFRQVEVLIADGNALEASVQAMTTIEEVLAS